MKAFAAAALYAARRHAGQVRKGAAKEPYVNHVLEVAARLAEAHPEDEALLLGGLLHDIVEDTEGTEAEIAGLFGAEVAALVMEVTDDKSLPKPERKRLQAVHAPHRSDRAKRIKLADKASNLAAIVDSPPAWPLARKAEYLAWARQVTDPCRAASPALAAAFDAEAARLSRHLAEAEADTA